MAFVVTPGAKAVMVAIVALDFLAAFCRLLALPVPQLASAGPLLWQAIWWTCFTATVAELMARLVRSPLGLASDTSAMVDMVLMGLEGHYGYTLGHPAGHALSLARLVLRGTALIQLVQARAAEERAKLEAALVANAKRQATLQALLDQARAKWQRESQTRTRTEGLMNKYKEQVDTLREALSIAAQEQLLRSELGFSGTGDGDEYADEAPERGDELTADELAMLEAAAHGPRFIVSADGSYTKLQAPSAMDMAADALRAGDELGRDSDRHA